MTTNTITMTGNETGYGLYSGDEVFNLTGYSNTALLNGADDTINVNGGGQDMINLNASGFTHGVTDAVNLGTSTFDTVLDSASLYHAGVAIDGAGGIADVGLSNRGGTTSVSLGYTGNIYAQYALGDINRVTLNGDATNAVTYTAGGFSSTSIGSAGDSYYGYSADVSLYGVKNAVSGGDESFTVTDSNGWGNSVVLGNGDNSVHLSGGENSVSLGNGDNVLDLSGWSNTASLGTGDNSVSVADGSGTLSFAGGDAGASDNLAIATSNVLLAAGNENVNVIANYGFLSAQLGNGDDTVNLGNARGHIEFGTSTTNTADNSFSTERGGNWLTFNGGQDSATLADTTGSGGYDTITLNGTMLGTTITTAGAFDKVTLAQDANAVVNDATDNGALHLILDADQSGGFGSITINGLATDELAQLSLVNASAYTITADNTPAGGITLHFDHGSVDLVGLQAVPNNLL